MKKLLAALLTVALLLGSLLPASAEKFTFKSGGADRTIYFRVYDSASSTGARLTTLAFNTGSLDCDYTRAGAAATGITLATQTATGAHSDGGFVHVGKGLYRLDLPDAATAAGVNSVHIDCDGAAGMVPSAVDIELVVYDPQDAGDLGLTNLDAAISTRASQTSVTTIDDFLDTEIAAILADTGELQTDWADGGRLDLILDARASQASVTTIDDFLDTEIAAILADTGELQTDWANGGRLDLILDARASQTSVDTVDSNVDAILLDTGTDGVQIATGGIEPEDFATAGTISAESGTTLSLSGGVAANDQFNIGFKIVVYAAADGSIEAASCITDTINGSPDQVITAEDISAFIAVSDPFDIISDAGCASGGSADWTSTELQQIRHRLGIDGTASAPSATPSLATQASVDTIDNFLDTEIAAILADTGELQTDWANGGRLDLILDARASQASVDTIDNFLDTEIATILADTGDLQADWANGGRLDLILDAAATQASLDTKIPTALTFTGSLVRSQVGGLDANVITAPAIQDGAIGAAEMGRPTGTVLAGSAGCNGGANSATTFAVSLTQATTNHWSKTQLITFTSGSLQHQTAQISSYFLTGGGVGCLTVTSTLGLTGVPGVGDAFEIVNK